MARLKTPSLIFPLALAIVFSGLSCSGEGTGSLSSQGLAGYWEGILPDGDFDGQQDDLPYHYIFLDITSHGGGTITGHFHRQVGTERSDGPLLGTIDAYNQFQLTTALDGATVTFTGNLESFVHNYEAEHFAANWTDSGGQSGTIVFVSVDSHMLPSASESAEKAAGPAAAKVVSDILTKDGGSGSPVIFVHGWNSNPNAWNSMIAKFKSDGHFNHYEVWRYGYDSKNSIETIGADLYRQVERAGLLDKNPFIVAHSMGGIVSRTYIKQGGFFTRLITLSSPHAGTPLGVFGPLVNESAKELAPCSGTLQNIFGYENSHNPFGGYAVVSGEITGGWRWVTVQKCGTVCAFGHCVTSCVDVPVWLWQFDRNYDTQHKAEWIVIKGMGFGDNDGVVPTASANFCALWSHLGLGCDICPPVNYEQNKLLTNYDHSMPLDPSAAPDVYGFVVRHL